MQKKLHKFNHPLTCLAEMCEILSNVLRASGEDCFELIDHPDPGQLEKLCELGPLQYNTQTEACVTTLLDPATQRDTHDEGKSLKKGKIGGRKFGDLTKD